MAKQPIEVVVASAGGGYAQTIQPVGMRFWWMSRLQSAWTDTGPDPYELLLASLGAFTSMTVQMYARQKAGRSRASPSAYGTGKFMPRIAPTADRRAGMWT